MKKQFLNEISRMRDLMLINEQGGPFTKLTTKKYLPGLMKFRSGILGRGKDTDELIERFDDMVNGRISYSEDEMVKIITELIEKDKKISDYLIPKIMQNFDLATKKQIDQVKERFADYITKNKLGKTEVDALLQFQFKPNNFSKLFTSPSQEIIKFVQQDIRNYLDDYMNKFTSGFRKGWSAKGPSYGTIFNFATEGPRDFMSKLFGGKGFTSNLSTQEKDHVKRWLISGLGDFKSISDSWKKLGFKGASGNVIGQLLKKWWIITYWKYILTTIFGLLKDWATPGEEISDKEMSDFSKLIWRLGKNLGVAGFGWVSPIGWFAGLIATVIFRGGGGGGGKAYKAFVNYLTGNDENNVPKWWDGINLSQWRQNATRNAQEAIQQADTEIQNTQNATTTPDTAIGGQITIVDTPAVSNQPQTSDTPSVGTQNPRNLGPAPILRNAPDTGRGQ